MEHNKPNTLKNIEPPMARYAKTAKGYIRGRKDSTGRLRMEHDLVWESYFGPIPEGMQVHHIDFDKTNNRIDNLRLVSALDHKRLHSGCVEIDGVWYKPCKVCGELKPCTPDYWYYARGYITGKTCKACYSKKVVADRRERVARGWSRKNGWSAT